MPRKAPFSGKKKKEQLQAKRQTQAAVVASRDPDAPMLSKKQVKKGAADAVIQSSRVAVQQGGAAEEIGGAYLAPIGRPRGSLSAGNSGVAPRTFAPQNAGHRYRLLFAQETRAEVEERKVAARLKLPPPDRRFLEIGMPAVFQPGSVLDMPKRPAWSFDMGKEAVLKQEERYFLAHLEKIYNAYPDHAMLSYFEHNLETWRQLWRVLEISDVLLLIIDVRYAPLHFPPPLYDFIVNQLGKPLILVFNKCDLVPETTVSAWEQHFCTEYPGINIVKFASFLSTHIGNPASRKKGRFRLSQAAGLVELLAIWERLKLPGLVEWQAKVRQQAAEVEQQARDHAHAAYQPDYDDSRVTRGLAGRAKALRLAGRHKAKEAVARGVDASATNEWLDGSNDDDCSTDGVSDDHDVDDADDIAVGEDVVALHGENSSDEGQSEEVEEEDESGNVVRTPRGKSAVPSFDISGQDLASMLDVDDFYSLPTDVKTEFVTLGMLGQPNVGKSTVLNSLVGRHVVSVSRTPGHTKHFQTYFMTPKLRLCDCPGIIFPSLMAKPLQVLSGLYPISQVREPYSAIMFLAQRVDLLSLLKLTPPQDAGRDFVWSAWTICEAWAERCGFYTAKAGRPDVYRAATSILHHTVDGRIVVSLKPPGYFAEHPEDEDESSSAVTLLNARVKKSARATQYVTLKAPQAAPTAFASNSGSASDSGSDGEPRDGRNRMTGARSSQTGGGGGGGDRHAARPADAKKSAAGKSVAAAVNPFALLLAQDD